MFRHLKLQNFHKCEDGGILVFWAMTLVIFMGFLALIFDFGRLATTHSELQSYADSVSLAAAAELDGTADAITRARTAANALITDTQTYADGETNLVAADIVTLKFFTPAPDGTFSSNPAFETTNPRTARYVAAEVADHSVSLGFGAAFSTLSGNSFGNDSTSAGAVAGFALEACNVAPVAACLPILDFDASTSIGQTLELQTSVNLTNLIPGQLSAVRTLTNSLDGLSICAGLLGANLEACLIAARQPETACSGQGGLELSADLSGSDLLSALNTRFGQFSGLASGLAGDPDFSAAPNVLTGLTNALGLCLPLNISPNLSDIGLPADDCFAAGTCSVQGNGGWSQGRQAYINANYGGNDPFPSAQTRFEFYQAEISAAAAVTGLPSLGGLLGFTPNLCAPQANQDPTRRLMVVAGIDCLSASVDATITTPPVQQFFEVFTLGPAENGILQVEITACLGGDCGTGNLGTEVHDIVRLVQ